eukprot:ctg_556.g282
MRRRLTRRAEGTTTTGAGRSDEASRSRLFISPVGGDQHQHGGAVLQRRLNGGHRVQTTDAAGVGGLVVLDVLQTQASNGDHAELVLDAEVARLVAEQAEQPLDVLEHVLHVGHQRHLVDVAARGDDRVAAEQDRLAHTAHAPQIAHHAAHAVADGVGKGGVKVVKLVQQRHALVGGARRSGRAAGV